MALGSMSQGPCTSAASRPALIAGSLLAHSCACAADSARNTKDATERRVIREWPRDHEFVFGSHLPDVSHVLFLKLFTRFFAELRRIGGTIQNHKEVLGRLGIRLGLGLHESRVRNREQAEQKYMAEDGFSHTRKIRIHPPRSLDDSKLNWTG